MDIEIKKVNEEKATEVDAYIQKLEKRIEKMKTNPDPNRPKSNLIRYEMTLDQAKARRDAIAAGKPFCDGGGPFFISILTGSMGFNGTGFLEANYQTGNAGEYMRQAGQNGLPVESACDMAVMPLAMTDLGMVPLEDCALCDAHGCTAMMLRTFYSACKNKKDAFTIDTPLDQDYDGIKSVAAQLQDFIDYAEANYDVHYDEDKLAETLEKQEEFEAILFDAYELLKAKPCPLSGLDVVSMVSTAGMGGAIEKRIEYAKALYGELKEKVDKGIGAVPNEKARIMWTVTRPFYMNPFETLHNRGISIPMFYSGGPLYHSVPLPWRHFWGDRELTPLEKIAARTMSDGWGHYGKSWVDGILWVCKDLGIDGIVNYNMLGCIATLGTKKMVADRAEKELGIPTLQLDARQWDPEYATPDSINEQLDNFATLVLNQKGAL